MARVSALTGELILDVNKWTAGVRQAQTDAGALGKSLGPITTIAATAGTALLGMATAAVGALVSATRVAANYGDMMRDASIRTGLSTEALAGLKIQAEQSGTSFEALSGGINILSRNMLAAIQRSGEQRRAFESIGISVKALKDSNGELDPILRKVADRFATMPDGAAKTAIAMQLLGKRGSELTEVLSAGSDGIDKFRDRAELFGLAISGEASAAASRMKDNVDELKKAMEGLTVQIGSLLIPQVAGFTKIITSALLGITQNIQGFFALAKAAIEIGKAFGVTAGAIALLKGVQEGINSVAVDSTLNFIKLADATDDATDSDKGRIPVLEDLEARTKALKEAEAERLKLMNRYIDVVKAVMDREEQLSVSAEATAESIKASVSASLESIPPLAGPIEQEINQILNRTKTAVEEFPGIYEEEFGVTTGVIRDEMGNIIAIVRDGNQKMSDEAAKAAEQTRQVWTHAVGNITSDFAKGLADVIFDGKKFGDAMVDIAKSTARSMFEAFLSGLLAPLTSKLGELGAKLGGALFGGAGAAGGGGSLIGGLATAGGGILGGIFGKGGGVAGTVAGAAMMSTPMGWASLGIQGAGLLIDAIGSIGAGRKSANKIVGSQNAFQKAVEGILSDPGLSALNQSKQIQNLWDAFLANSQAFAAGGGPNATTSNQAFATLLPWIANIQSGLAKQIGNGETGGGPQTVNNYNVTIVVPEGKNARATVALFQSEGIPTFINWIQNNTGGITSAVTVAVKNSLQGVVTTA